MGRRRRRRRIVVEKGRKGKVEDVINILINNSILLY
jgi:hypothetical protein